MSIAVSQTASVERQGSLDFTCPRCGEEGAGLCSRTVYRGKLFFLLPIFKSSITRVTCNGCGTEFRSGCDFDVLLASSQEQITRALSPSVSFVTKALNVVGFLLILVPVVNVIAFGVAFVAAWRSSSKWRTVALVGAILSLVWTVAFFAFAAIA